MLIKPMFHELDAQDPVLLVHLNVMGIDHAESALELAPGVYEIQHFNGNFMLAGKWNQYPELGDGFYSAYGVCDSYEQILAARPEVPGDPDRQFCVMLTKVARAEQPDDGGWRWHKWGPYIGAQKPQHEYLYDEKDIEFVYCYHIYEKI